MTEREKKAKSLNVATIVFALIALIAVGAAGYLYWQNNELRSNPKASSQAASNKAADIKAKVGKLISVPDDETPTLASVTDKTKLKDQPFFKEAENGDQILIFPQAKKAIIYREKDNRLINVGPIAITSDKAPTTPQGTTPQQPQQPTEKKQ